MINVFHAFSGVDSQLMAEKRVWGENNVKLIGTMEVDVDAIISAALIHKNKEFHEMMDRDIDLDKAKSWLKERNIGYDFDKNKSKIDRMNKTKLKQLLIASLLTKNYGDISLANTTKIAEDIDLFIYSSPCTSFSIAGKQEGLQGVSGLLLECEKFIRINKPKVLMLENVKNLVGKKFKKDFDNWVAILDRLGYNSYWKVLNAKDFGVPQNRERVFCISVRKEDDKVGYTFPQGFALNRKLKDTLQDSVDEKYYYKNERANELIKMILEKYQNKTTPTIIPCDSTIYRPKELEVANCITARYDAGIQKKGSIGVAIIEPLVAETRCDEGVRLFKDNMCGTIRTISGGGDKVILEQKSNRLGGLFDDHKGKHQAGSIWDSEGLAPTLDTMQGGWRQPMIITEGHLMPSCHAASRVVNSQGISPTVMENHGLSITIYDNYAIRKLTPNECWTLMDFDQDAFDKVSKYISDSQLYKQAGNSIVVSCMEHIFRELKKEILK